MKKRGRPRKICHLMSLVRARELLRRLEVRGSPVAGKLSRIIEVVEQGGEEKDTRREYIRRTLAGMAHDIGRALYAPLEGWEELGVYEVLRLLIPDRGEA